MGLRLGLCCKFVEQNITFRTTTAKRTLAIGHDEGLAQVSDICVHNARSLMGALEFCHGSGIGCFRIGSDILPIKTHPEAGYELVDLPEGGLIGRLFLDAGAFARSRELRTVLHPDQFIVLNSPRPDVVEKSICDLESQAAIAESVNADVINIHAGGVYGDKEGALDRLATVIGRLPDAVRSRLTLENDDRSYTPADLLPLCRDLGIPLVYDVHHHRCNPDDLSVEEATDLALSTWDREPLFHISSPRDRWDATNPRPHHDFIDPGDFPECWRYLDLTVEVEAKAKELAVLRLAEAL